MTITTKRRRWGGYVIIIITTVVIRLLDQPHGDLPAIGKLLDPVNGCLANAERTTRDFGSAKKIAQLQGNASVMYDERLVPHIRAVSDHDLYFLQGYIHASFRLWQMDMQTRAAAGRVSEVVGEKTFEYDRKQRRKGMLYAAERSLAAAEADSRTKVMLDAYTEGVNAFIGTLSYGDYPLEYKLMSFAPEPWTNLKCVLMLKYMADDLSGKTDDIAHSYLRTVLPAEDFDLLYPDKISGSTPVIPRGTAYPTRTLPEIAAPADSIAFPSYRSSDFGERSESGKGSNNWALGPSKTASGAAILCNDPHLALNLPSVWFEVQLTGKDMNVYGASMPGAPGVVIGFNDSLTWGLTNNYRDVKDFYQIYGAEGDASSYMFGGERRKFDLRIEEIKIKGKPTFNDTMRYTLHGPVMYDEHYNEKGSLKNTLAVSWMGHRGSNELLAIYMLNRARGYTEFVDAILHFECPAQNIIYADRRGNIALWGQGQYVNKWKGQGKYVMNGSDSATLWRELIPMNENPHTLNPETGFLSSANQNVTDSSYGYWYNGDFTELRAWRINDVLGGMQHATVEDMFGLQNDNYSVLASKTLPLMLWYCKDVNSKYLDTLRQWDYRLTMNGTAATIYQLWWRNLYSDIWKDEFSAVPGYVIPLPERTMQLMLADSTLKYYDSKRTAKKEVLRDMVLRSLKETTDSLQQLEKSYGLAWYRSKNTSATHLTKIAAFSYDSLKTGGWGNTVNAMKGGHGPSWRMVVEMGKEIEAWGVYPGGQSGNPGSKYYADYLQNWVEGKYYKLVFLPGTQAADKRIKYTWAINK
jgi:penicillin amidase